MCYCALHYHQFVYIYDTCCHKTDLDECYTEIHNCHERAACYNTDSSYVCRCHGGWIGNGRYCSGNVCLQIAIKSACLIRSNLYGQMIFRFHWNFAERLPSAKKSSREKEFLSQPSESTIRACPSKMASKNECYHSAQEWHTNEPSSIQH